MCGGVCIVYYNTKFSNLICISKAKINCNQSEHSNNGFSFGYVRKYSFYFFSIYIFSIVDDPLHKPLLASKNSLNWTEGCLDVFPFFSIILKILFFIWQRNKQNCSKWSARRGQYKKPTVFICLKSISVTRNICRIFPHFPRFKPFVLAHARGFFFFLSVPLTAVYFHTRKKERCKP